MIDLSIIIVTYNPGSIFLDCLRSLHDAVGKLAYEVIVVDNDSQDGIIHETSLEFPTVQFLMNTDNRGFASGNNQGLKLAQGRNLLLLNPDVILEPNSLAIMVDYLDKNTTVGVVGPHTCDAQGRVTLTAYPQYTPFTMLWQYWGLARLFPYHVFGRYRRAIETTDQPFEVAWVQGSCLMLRHNVYDAIGGMDEGFFLFVEEPDLCDRALQAGWKTVHLPAAKVAHHESTSVSRYPERRIRSYHISPLYYFRKRNANASVTILKFGFTIELALKMMIRYAQAFKNSEMKQYLKIYHSVLINMWQY